MTNSPGQEAPGKGREKSQKDCFVAKVLPPKIQNPIEEPETIVPC